MSNITPALVKELRENTGAGMMDCKKALTEVAGDMDAAVDWLRKKGLAAAEKKSGRVAAEGLVGVAVQGLKGAVLEVNAETDFVSRNDHFKDFVKKASNLMLEAENFEALKTHDYPDTQRNVSDELTHLISVIGENMNLRRGEVIEVSQGAIASYIHTQTEPGLGRIGVLVGLESEGDAEKLGEIGRQIAMHVAAANPSALNRESVDAESLEREKQVLADKARASGKPENIIEKMVEGGLRKFYEDNVLLEQVYVIDGKSKVEEVVNAFAKELGHPVKLTGFIRFGVGEGIEKEETDFAEEVAAQVNK